MSAFDWNDVTYCQSHRYLPFVNSFQNSDEIRIKAQTQEAYTVPGDSVILIKGTVTYAPKPEEADAEVARNVIMTNNAPAFMFEQIRYELNGSEIDRSRHVGITSTARTYVTCSKDEVAGLEISGFGSPTINPDGRFRFLVELAHFLGFARDNKGRFIARQPQELVLIRSRTDQNAYMLSATAETDAVTLSVTNVEWNLPHIKFTMAAEKSLMDLIQKNASFQIKFNNWETHEYPQLPQNNKETWELITTSNVEVAAYIILVFQEDRTENEKKDANKFDHAHLRTFRVRLNDVTLPYENLNEDFEKNKFLFVYQNYRNGIPDLSNGEKLCEPPLTMEIFKNGNTIYVMKCKYPDILKAGSLEIQIEMESHKNSFKGTSVHAICVNPALMAYQSLAGIVKRLQ